jgi:glycosyltransferase involved in cell wall biosynthesis
MLVGPSVSRLVADPGGHDVLFPLHDHVRLAAGGWRTHEGRSAAAFVTAWNPEELRAILAGGESAVVFDAHVSHDALGMAAALCAASVDWSVDRLPRLFIGQAAREGALVRASTLLAHTEVVLVTGDGGRIEGAAIRAEAQHFRALRHLAKRFDDASRSVDHGWETVVAELPRECRTNLRIMRLPADGTERPIDVSFQSGEGDESATAHPRITTQDAPPRERRSRVSFIGPWSFECGLGEAARGYVAALTSGGVTGNLYGLRGPFGPHARIFPPVDVLNFHGAAEVCVVHLNPEAWPHALDARLRTVIAQARFRIGLWVWESDAVPGQFLQASGRVDAIWVPSIYCANAIRGQTSALVHTVGHRVDEPRSDGLQLRRLLGADERRTILYCFDGASYLIRKNPHALARAFLDSGLAAENWRLVLKAKSLGADAELARQLVDTVRASNGAIQLLERALPAHTARALIAECDVYASPHRSEGFGLTIAEAMACGKHVVATNHGGSVDFLDEETGYPVPWSPERLEHDHGAYRAGTRWARIDEARLAARLREAAEDVVAGRKDRANRGRRRIAERYSLAAISGAIDASLSEILR